MNVKHREKRKNARKKMKKMKINKKMFEKFR